ncbi:MAG: tyrosine-type recombinase/integrase [Gammaproteobacteria bacterium]|nr:tyrosine-type recombinase/integrase [Gammaproteobacteria bacterium]MBQ0841317.1 tyrosine-type recombinase/integrase [Gammaproteobacteria bacterium]
MPHPSRFTFTQKAIEQLPANPISAKATEAEYSDVQVPGLKLLIGKTGTKKFLLRYTFHGHKKALALGPYGALSVVEARRRANHHKADIAQDVDPKAAREQVKLAVTFAEFIEEHYLPHARANKRSAHTDASKLTHHILPVFGQQKLGQITLVSVQGYLNHLSSTLAPATCNRHFSLLHRVFALAVLWGFVVKNPVTGISKFKENNQRQRFLAPEEIRRLFQAADEDANYYAANYIKFLLLTGVRRAEGLSAQWQHIDLEAQHPSWYLPETKAGKSRYVLLNPMAVALLQGLERMPGNAYCFPGQVVGKPLCNPIKAFKRIIQSAGIEVAFRLHDLRHTTASLIVNGGGSLYDVQATLGHSSSRMSQRYAHLSQDRRSQTATRVSEGVAYALGCLD